MRRWMADVAGLAIGTAIGGAVLTLYWPQVEAIVWRLAASPSVPPAAEAAPALPPAPKPPAPRPPAPTPSGRAPAASRPSAHPKSPPPLPTVQHPTASRQTVIAMAPALPVAPPPPDVVTPAPLPTVIRPGSPPSGTLPRPAPGTIEAGTGFFIAADGSLLTAAHVVAGCSRAQIVSNHVALTTANVLAVDPYRDIALLRAAQARPPAILPVGHPARSGRVFVLGYPARAGMLVPEEDWADLRSDLIARTAATLDIHDAVWLESRQITHGYSGGPIMDGRSGAVVAIVRAGIEGAAAQAILGRSGGHIATGPTGERLASFVHREAPWIDLASVLSGGEGPVETARLATVHVICTR